MRVTSMVAGLAIVLAACGGEKKAEDQSTTATPEQQPAAAPAAAPAAGGGAAHDVNMVLEGSTYKFDPAELTIKVGRRGQLPQQERRPAQRVVLGRQHPGRRGATC